MAEETISTRIVANADFSALIADVHRVTASLSKLQTDLASSNKMMANQIAVMNRSFSDTLRSTGQYSTHFVSLQSDVEKFGKNLDGGKLKLNQYFNAFRDQAKTSGGLIRDLAKQQVALQNAVLQPLGRNAQGLMQFNVHVPRGLDELKNKTAIARTELQIMNKVIQDGANQVINFGKNTQWTGRQLTVGLTVPLVAFGSAAAKAFREADQELVRLMKVYGGVAETSSAELGKVRDDVVKTSRDLSAAMGVSFKETIALAADIAATGKQGDELIGSIQETTRLAVLGEVDRQEAMKATLAIQSAFKQNTEELSESINFLNAVENQTSTTLNDLVEAIPKAGPIIQGLGGSVQDLALYLTAMREGGINAAEGANALKSALASLINPTDVAVGKFQGLGIDLLGIVNKNAGDLTGTLMALQGALDNLDPLQKQQAIEQLFGKFQFSRLNALFENLGRQGSQTLQVLDLMNASTEELAAVAGRELEAVTESASGKYRRALEGLKASLAEVGEQFLTINTVLITVIDKIVQFAMNLPGPVKQVLALLGGVTAIAGPLIMLTGLLANFFGNMAKGVFHLKAFFKGGEGFKYLTPEMLAAQKAGALVEQSFYSDAKAAAVLKQALGNLIDEFSILEAKAKSGAMSVNPAVSTMAGNLVMAAGGQRVVNPNHPLAGAQGTRASSHMVPRSSMTEQQRLQQTMFGMVPGSIPVNQKIGQNPQIYMNEQLPNVPGLTTVGGVSTGIVSSEAARHHAMMATLAMQSKTEIAQLKQTIAATGTVSKDFMNQFDDILPIVSRLTDNAAKESALIVAELRAGKLSVEAARAKIVALNLETERMIASSMQTQATAIGRTINPTMVPTLNQPVVDPTGKSNMRELFKKGKTRDFINKIAGALGVRTSGAGYNIETTVPKKFELGGEVIGGPRSDKTDTQFKILKEGGFVLNREASDSLLGLNRGGEVPAMVTPGEIYFPNPNKEELGMLEAYNNKFNLGGRITASKNNYGLLTAAQLQKLMPKFRGSKPFYKAKSTAGTYIGDITDSSIVKKYGSKEQIAAGVITRQSINASMIGGTVPGPVLKASVLSGVAKSGLLGSGDQFLLGLYRSGVISKQQYKHLSRLIKKKYLQYLNRSSGVGDQNNDYFGIVNKVLNDSVIDKKGILLWEKFSKQVGAVTSAGMRSSGKQTSRSTNAPSIKIDGINFGKLEGSDGTLFAHSSKPQSFIDELSKLNRGGRIRGYNRGGTVGGLVSGKKFNYGKLDPATPNSGMGSGMATSFAGFGLMGAGSMIGGGIGQAMNYAGIAMQMTPLLSFLPKLPPALTKTLGPFASMASTVTKTSGSLTGLTKVFNLILKPLSLILRAINPVTAALTVLAVGIKVFTDKQKEIEEANRISRLGFGMTADAAKKAGYSYVDYNKRVKDVIGNLKAMSERNKMIYESMTQAGVPFKMTIEQYKKLKETVKDTMGDYVKLFDATKVKDVGQLAVQLKSQFMAAGDSAEEATAKIYTLIGMSNKASMAGGAIGTQSFKSIQTLQDAAESSIRTFNFAANVSDAKGQVDSLLGAFGALDGAIKETVVKSRTNSKDAATATITEYEASLIVIEKINQKVNVQKNITTEMIAELAKTNPELAIMLSSSDTIVTAFEKLQVLAAGININVSELSGAAATAAAKITGQVQLAVRANATVKLQADAYKALQAQIKAAGDAQKGLSAKQQIDSRKTVEGLQKQIALIKQQAKDKIDAIRKQTEAANAELDIQKQQLAASQALVTGDMAGYAESQLNIKQIVNTQQQKSAEEAIEKEADLEIAPLQKQLDALSKKSQDLADNAALAGDRLGGLQRRAKDLDENYKIYTTNLDNLAFKVKTMGDSFRGSDEYKNAMIALEEAGKKLGINAKPETILNEIVKSLKDISAETINVYLAGGGKLASFGQGGTSSNPRPLGVSPYDLRSYGNPFNQGPSSVREMVKSMAQSKGVTPGEYFTLQDAKGKEYKFKVREDGNITMVSDPYEVKKAMGGRVVPGIPYTLNDGGKVEGIKFDRPGYVYPNINTMPKYNIASGSKTGLFNFDKTSSTVNNVYNIDIELNGTNLTADDVVRAFENKMATINAKVGRTKNYGGQA